MPRSTEQTRKQILDGAYRLFRRRGYSRVTMDDIATEAKFTKRTLYHHFKSKDQLLKSWQPSTSWQSRPLGLLAIDCPGRPKPS